MKSRLGISFIFVFFFTPLILCDETFLMYSKYPSDDSFAKDCSEVAQTSGDLEYIEVRNFQSAADGRKRCRRYFLFSVFLLIFIDFRGTLFPYDLSINGWCSGSESGSGGRQAFFLFDMTDFSPAAAVDSASFHVTFDEFPFGARLQFYTCSTDWKENQVISTKIKLIIVKIISIVGSGDME